MFRVQVKPEMLRRARERAGLSADDLHRKFPKMDLWESEEVRPTLKQLEAFAKATYLPIGYFFVGEMPDDKIPIPDLRTIGNREVRRPSPNLLDTIYLCQQRQTWYHDYAREQGDKPLDFVRSVDMESPVEDVAAKMRETLNFDLDARRQNPTWTDALREFIEQADDAGVMVMTSGVVGNNPNRKLDVKEFRGFALADRFAPLVFINGTDSKSAQMFTLAHELAHIWLGENALTDDDPRILSSNKIEVWCNRVAAEFLVPLDALKQDLRADAAPRIRMLAHNYKVSNLVILRRLLDADHFDRQEFQREYEAELARLQEISGGAGGDFYRTVKARVSNRFARDLVASTLEGRTSFSESFYLLGIQKMETFKKFGRQLGVFA
ncbi:MAG: XRE family transcriptional regulator [Pirellulales bacterium]|nr:XRE family transcriptional regulator [Alphaproteobacteria bacterium]MDA8041324.1 XRE family transcriptional regulator [Pirellulales bacterium]